MGQLNRVASSLAGMSEIKGVAAVPPSQGSTKATEAETLSVLHGPTAADAKTFEQAGWRFIAAEGATGPVGQRRLFTNTDGRLVIGGERLNVKFAPDLNEAAIRSLLDACGLSIKRKLGFGGALYSVGDAGSRNILDLADLLAQHDGVVYAEPELIEPIAGRGSR